MRGRLTLEKVNIAINEVATYADANAHLISCPKKKVCVSSALVFIDDPSWAESVHVRAVGRRRLGKGFGKLDSFSLKPSLSWLITTQACMYYEILDHAKARCTWIIVAMHFLTKKKNDSRVCYFDVGIERHCNGWTSERQAFFPWSRHKRARTKTWQHGQSDSNCKYRLSFSTYFLFSYSRLLMLENLC